MATRPKDWDHGDPDHPAEPGHDEFVRAKAAKGLAQSRDRAAMIPVEQAWRDLVGER